MQRKVPLLEGEFYHIYNRGVDRRKIFSSTKDYQRFMALLYLANSKENVRISNLPRDKTLEDIFLIDQGEPLVAIGAFCLMPNHFHILATPLLKDGLSRFMLKLQTGYSMYFNLKYERSGSLFQGPFKSNHAEENRYLKYLFSYIHLNPASLKNLHWEKEISSKDNSLMKFVENYRYSSFNSYLKKTHIITNPIPFPDYFSSQKALREHLTDWFEDGQEQARTTLA